MSEPLDADQLYMACRRGEFGRVKALHALGGDLNLRDDYGYTGLMGAVQGGHRDLVAWLVRAPGIEIDAQHNHGRTALHWAALHGRADCVPLLLEAGADARIKDTLGENALELAQHLNESEVVGLLQQHAAAPPAPQPEPQPQPGAAAAGGGGGGGGGEAAREEAARAAAEAEATREEAARAGTLVVGRAPSRGDGMVGGSGEGAWPAELRELVSIPRVAACLEALEVRSLADVVQCVDVEEGHDAQLQAVVDALPSKPRRNKLLRNRAKMALADLLWRLSVFVEFDTDEDGFLSRVECMRMPLEKMRAKAGGTVADHFDRIDQDRDGRISFAELFAAAELAEGAAPPSLGRTTGVEPAGIHVWVKAPDGRALRVVATDGLATTVAQIRSMAADAARLEVSCCRLIFAGKELEGHMSLADYNCEHQSELHLILRVEEEATSVDAEAEQQTAAMRARMVDTKLVDFLVSKKIGGKDIAAIGGASQSISQSGVCSYVYLAQLRSGPPVQFALKVMLNYEEGRANSVAIRHEFDAETALLSDPNRLPAHRHVMVVLHSFTDNAAALPFWNFETDIVNPCTMFVVMPYFPTDLKRMFKIARQQGEVFGALRVVRIVFHLLSAVRHLKSHGIVHRDVKLDNVMIASPGTLAEAAVLTDFGMCLDLTKNRISDFRVPMPYDGIRRGGAPIALAPEVTLPEPGPDVCLDYSKNDEWAVGMIAHELLSQEGASPFADMEHPASYSDAGYQDETIPQLCRPLVSGLLRVAVADRVDATDGSRRAKRLEAVLTQDTDPTAQSGRAVVDRLIDLSAVGAHYRLSPGPRRQRPSPSLASRRSSPTANEIRYRRGREGTIGGIQGAHTLHLERMRVVRREDLVARARRGRVQLQRERMIRLAAPRRWPALGTSMQNVECRPQRYISAERTKQLVQRLAVPRHPPALFTSERAKKLSFDDLPRKGQPTWAGQVTRLQSCADMLSLFPWSQAYRESVVEGIQMFFATECAGRRIEIDDGLMFFYPRPLSGFEIAPLVVPPAVPSRAIPTPVRIFDKLSREQLAARGFGRDKPTAADGQYTVADKLTFDASRPTVGVQAEGDPIALQTLLDALVRVDARIKESKQVSAAKNTARKMELRQFLEEQRAVFREQHAERISEAERISDGAWFRKLQDGIAQEIDMITRSEEYSGVQESTPFPIAPATKMAHIALIHEACNIDGRWGKRKYGVAPGEGVDFVWTMVPPTKSARRNAQLSTEKISFDANRPVIRVHRQPDPAGLEKHKQSLLDLDAKIKKSCEIAGCNNQHRKRELSKFLEQQKAAMLTEKHNASRAERSDAADDPCSAEQATSEPDDDFLQLVEGVAQEMAIIDRAEARVTQPGQDLNSVAFLGFKVSDEQLAAQSMQAINASFKSWVEAKQNGAKEWGFENRVIAGVDANSSQFPLRCMAMKLDGEPGGHTEIYDRVTNTWIRQFEPAQEERIVDPATLRPDTSERPLVFDLPKGESAWKLLPEPTPLTEDDLTRCETMFVRDFPEMFTFELPSQLADVVQNVSSPHQAKATWKGATFEQGVAWAVVPAITPLTEAEVDFAKNWAENCLRAGSHCDLPEFDFEFPAGQSTAWGLLIGDNKFDIIDLDECTDAQLAVAAARAARNNLEETATRRRAQLAARFRCGVPSAEFLTERLAPSEAELPRIIEAHKAMRRAEKVAHEEQQQALHRQPLIERTEAQLEILAARRVLLASRFNCDVPSPEFLTERLAPSEEHLPAIIEAHKTKRLKEKAVEAAALQQLIECAVASMHVAPEKLLSFFERKGSFFERKGHRPPEAFLKSNWPIDDTAYEHAIAQKRPYKQVKAELEMGPPEGVPPKASTGVKDWTSSQVVAWLRDAMKLEGVAQLVMAEGGVDGAAAVMMDKNDWKELGASGVKATKIMSQLHRLQKLT